MVKKQSVKITKKNNQFIQRKHGIYQTGEKTNQTNVTIPTIQREYDENLSQKNNRLTADALEGNHSSDSRANINTISEAEAKLSRGITQIPEGKPQSNRGSINFKERISEDSMN